MTDRITRDAAEVMRDEMTIRGRILDLLSEEPLTIPEIAQTLGYKTHEVVSWVMAMWNYKLVEETGKANSDGYFTYRVRANPEDEG
ncbi:MarR family transcriptional regulator [bacterium]|nr:MarR family transcriptional regulator [bacterium]